MNGCKVTAFLPRLDCSLAGHWAGYWRRLDRRRLSGDRTGLCSGPCPQAKRLLGGKLAALDRKSVV